VSTGIVVFAHGSRVASANDAVRAVVADLGKAGGFDLLEAAFLELGHPNLEVAVRRLVGRGATQIVVVPYFLTLGTHLERDLPALVKAVGVQHRGLDVTVTAPLDGHPALLQILLDRIATVAIKA
jgi:sirohydrochlorin ferrochelatase